MAIKISPKLRTSIANEASIDSKEVEEYLWGIKPHDCFLCGEKLNRAGSETIELDHDIPSSRGGEDSIKNLNFTHSSCNKYKRDNPTLVVRDLLKFKRFYDRQNGAVNFKGALTHFEISETNTYVTIDEGTNCARFETTDGEIEVPIFSEKVGGKSQRFCFVELPISAVTNDDDIQPRQLKLGHLLKIAADMQKNPLHEQPACRLVKSKKGQMRILMFDGQHKTVARLINTDDKVVFKIYLDLTRDDAVKLVNSIQSRIGKLGLTAFELAAKMADEVKRHFEKYEEIDGMEISEEAFIKWLDKTDQPRAKAGIASAVIDGIINDPDLNFNEIIARHGNPVQRSNSITESNFQNSVVKQLAHHKPLSKDFIGEAMRAARNREKRQIVKLLQVIFDSGYTPFDSEDDAAFEKRLKRLVYQASLKYISGLVKKIARQETRNDDVETTFLEKEISEAQWNAIIKAVQRLFDHPIWSCEELSVSEKTRAVELAMSTNQGIEAAFRGVGLDLGYCLGDDLPKDWNS